MKTWHWVLIAVVIIGLGAYFYLKPPSLSIETIDKLAKTAVIRIGGKEYNYSYDDETSTMIPLSRGYQAIISANEGNVPISTVSIKKHGTQSIYFTRIGTIDFT